MLEYHGEIVIPSVNRDIMSLFITLQMLRTAEIRAQLVQFTQNLQGISSSYDPAQDARNLHIQFLWKETMINDMAEQMRKFIWIFAKTDSDQTFYTSDHPVLVKSPDNREWLLGPRIFDEGVYVVFPLSPSWILYCYDRDYWKKLGRFDETVSPVILTSDMVNHENSGQVGRSLRFIFSKSPDFEFAKEYLLEYPEHGNPERKRFG